MAEAILTSAPAVSLQNLRFFFFVAALVLYAIAGSPTPDHPGWTEATIGVLLIVAIGFKPFAALLLPGNRFCMALIFFLYGIGAGCLVAALKGHALELVLRDIAAFLFLCLPLFAWKLVEKENRKKIYAQALAFIGLCFSLRALVPVFSLSPVANELLYLANSPLVLLTALLLAGQAWQILQERSSPFALLQALVLCTLILIPVMAMMIDVQRANLGALAFSITCLLIWTIIMRPQRVIIPAIIICILVTVFWSDVQTIGHEMAFKTAQVGLNMRLQEAQAVLEEVSESWLAFLFGQGWGATFHSPAVGGLPVNYTHSLVTYLLLKTGIIGLALGMTYIGTMLWRVTALLPQDLPRFLSLIWPLAIPVFLYASYKSLDFGLLLLLAVSVPQLKNKAVLL